MYNVGDTVLIRASVRRIVIEGNNLPTYSLKYVAQGSGSAYEMIAGEIDIAGITTDVPNEPKE